MHAGSESWWRGCCLPLRSKEMASLKFWIGVINWTASLMFLCGAVQAFVSDHLTLRGNQLMTAFTWLLGCILFAVHGFLIYLSSLNPTLE